MKGLLLDTTFLVNAERQRQTMAEATRHLASHHGRIEVAISVISVMELAQGLVRAGSEQERYRRLLFREDIAQTTRLIPVSTEIATLAGQIGEELKMRGTPIAVQELLIGCTALWLEYGVVTSNVRHFERIPGVQVVLA